MYAPRFIPATDAAEATPKGKRSVRRSVYGNLNGYVSGRFWVSFGEAFDGPAEREAEAWLAEPQA